jgi:hypothetical protein
MAFIKKYPFIFILLCAIGLTALQLTTLPIAWSPFTLLVVGISIHVTKLILTAAGAAFAILWIRNHTNTQRN